MLSCLSLDLGPKKVHCGRQSEVKNLHLWLWELKIGALQLQQGGRALGLRAGLRERD